MEWLHKLSCLMLVSYAIAPAQRVEDPPDYRYGLQLGGNLNSYAASVRSLNGSTIAPGEFHNGTGVDLSVGGVIEYRPSKTWGGSLSIVYDGRGGRFDGISVGGAYSLLASLAYLEVEPSLRWCPFRNGFHAFAGPTFGLLLRSSFEYTKPSLLKLNDAWSDVRSLRLGAQLGIGYDLQLVGTSGLHEVTPFISVHTGQAVRSTESWNMITLRGGVQLKLGVQGPNSACDVDFSIGNLSPREKVMSVEETFPLLGYIFFDEGISQIPRRYNQITRQQAAAFDERQLGESSERRWHKKSAQQLCAYWNILNVLGARMRVDTAMKVCLSGVLESAAWKGSPHQADSIGRSMALSVRKYLLDVFDISTDRIEIRADRPRVESGDKKNFEPLFTSMCQAENRRVEISPPLKPVRLRFERSDFLDSLVVIPLVGQDALNEWTLQVFEKTDGVMVMQREIVDGKIILPTAELLNGRAQGSYLARLWGTCRCGENVKREVKFALSPSRQEPSVRISRYGVLYDFDVATTAAVSEVTIREDVLPTIPLGSRVSITGYTDIIGDSTRFVELSMKRANEVKRIFDRETAKLKSSPFKMTVRGLGGNVDRTPFDNRLPEERFYNRTAIIEIELP